MKKYFLGLWISVLSFAQTDTTAVIQEIDFTEASEKCYQSYSQKLSDKNKLYPPKTAVFKGIYTKNGEDIPFSGEIESKNNFTIKNIKVHQHSEKIAKDFYKEFFKKLYKVLYSHYWISKDSKYLEKFYCQYKNEEFYDFIILGNKAKKSVKLSKDKKGNFSVWLTSQGILDKIISVVDKKNDSNQSKTHNFTLTFKSDEKDVKFQSSKGVVVDHKNQNKITFEIHFD